MFLFELDFVMRSYILGALFTGLLIESIYFTILGKYKKGSIGLKEHKMLSFKYLLIDGLILTFFSYFLIVSNLFPAKFTEKEFLLLSIIYISWLISAATTHKFILVMVSNNKWNAFELQVKFYTRILAFVFLSMIFLQVDYSSSIYFIYAMIGYSILSSFVSMFLFAEKIKNKTDEATVVFLKAYEMSDPVVKSNGKNGNGKYSFKGPETSESVVRQKIQFEYLKEHGEVFSVLDTMLDLKSFDTRKSVIIKSDEPNNLSSYQSDFHQLFVNLHVLNDQVRINDYILDVRNRLVPGGVFVGALLPHHYRYRRYLKKFSFWTANTLYFFDFIWKRVLPKIPITREIYSAFSKEKDRAISLAEGLGRLVYCGFKVLDLAVVDDVVYFAAARNGLFTPVKKFFYSPFFKMKRVGKDGKIIYVYKLRTMYPYSEFIQDFVYEHNNLEAGGKFKDDFRVPTWGKIFRKLWIDELPMLINWVKRDLKLVGVRPISMQYLSLYSKEHQERRKTFKPGLLPPFYADLPKSIQEIELSEKRYLDAYEKNPFKTDIKYFIKALNNILIKKKRSA
jgi:lipopolysaccharide/colanic/teichoic acid biosynthesis glycosyltransferase